MTALRKLLRWRDAAGRSVAVFLGDVGHGMLELSHNTLALLGLLVVAVGAFGIGQPVFREAIEQQALGWLLARHEARAENQMPALTVPAEPGAVARATAAEPTELTQQQATVAQWISRRYHVAPEPINRLVKEAWAMGNHAGLDPTLILAIMAVESSFNPFAQSAVGAQGLMQVMTRVHDDKYEPFGGNHAAFDPVTNLRVGVLVLKECIGRAGGLEAGLRFYVGAAAIDSDGGYAGKVLAEQSRLRLVASGKPVPVRTPNAPPPTPAAAEDASADASGAPASAPSAPRDSARSDQLALLR